MTSHALSSLWSATAPAIADHLWQSTLVAAAAAVLMLLLRKHNARARYWLWLATSLKFLFPFSVLVQLGRYLSWSHAPATSSTPQLYVVMDQIGRPFSDSASNVAMTHAPVQTSWTLPQLSSVLAGLWLLGFVAVVLLWSMRWWRISSAVRNAMPSSGGRELQALRRMERLAGIRQNIALLVSRTSLEPGVFGVFKPVLLWPEGISEHLDDANLEAVVAHEVWHVRRRDNLFAVLHMLVEAVFWFYPLVWWIGARLIDERERACDEEVVALGNDRQIYAESILKVCEFCLGSPLPCVSGVTGADLKKRMVHIMNDRILHQLDFVRKLLLTAAAFVAITLPVTFGVFHATPTQAQTQTEAVSTTPVFESVSIKPDTSTDNGPHKIMFSLEDGSFTARGVTLRRLIEMAYHLQPSQLSGGPDWLDTSRFDIDTRLNSARVAAMKQAGPHGALFDGPLLLKALLTDFKVSVHNETRNLPVYELSVDSGGSKLQEVKEPGLFHLDPGELVSQGVPIELLANELSSRLGRVVVDRTGLDGTYAFNLRWTPDSTEDVRVMQTNTRYPGDPTPAPPQAAPQVPAETLQAAVQDQLGLKLESKTDPIQVLLVDHAEQPAGN